MTDPAVAAPAPAWPEYVPDAGFQPTQSPEEIAYFIGVPRFRAWPIQQLSQAKENRSDILKGRLRGLFLHWQSCRNPHLVLDAIDSSVEAGATPPAWAMLALPPIHDRLVHPNRHPGAANGLRKSRREYALRMERDPAMRAIHKLVAGCGLKVAHAALRVSGPNGNAETLAKYYRDEWRPFYRRLGYVGAMTRVQKLRCMATYRKAQQPTD